MPEKATIERARRDKREGKAPSTQAGEFVKEEIDHIREGKHGAKSTKQAIAIGLSKARRAGVDLPPPEKGEVPEETRRKAKRDLEAGDREGGHAEIGKRKGDEPSPARAKATKKALKKAGRSAASKSALSKQAKTAARKRSASDRSAAARKAAQTKGKKGRSEAAKKAARTRAASS